MTVELPGLPPEVTVEAASWPMLEAVAELYRVCEQDRVGHARTTDDDVRFRWLALPDLARDTLVVLDDDTLVAYEEFHAEQDPWSQAPDLFFDGRVHPDHTRRGLATYLFARAEQRALEMLATSGDDRAVLRTMVEDLDELARAYFVRRGFEPVRYLLQLRLPLDRPPPRPEWPDGVSVRHPRPDDDETIWRLYEAAFADHPEHVPMSLDDFLHDRLVRDPHADRSLWWLAEDRGGTPVGLCLARAGTPEHPGHGHIRDLAVDPAQHRRGIGLALLRTAFDAFIARGLVAAELEVDDVTMTGAVALYERAGMQIIHRTEILERKLRVPRPGSPGPA